MVQGIKTLGSLGVPVYVTETGIPDKTGKKREEFFKTYPAQVSLVQWRLSPYYTHRREKLQFHLAFAPDNAQPKACKTACRLSCFTAA